MENIHFSKSRTGHSYYYNTGMPIAGLCNRMLHALSSPGHDDMRIPEADKLFYLKKINYLESHIDTIPAANKSISFVEIEPSTVLNNLANLNQIVFEVTDACNLKCKYCGYGAFYNDYDERRNKKLDLPKAISFLKYLEDIWSRMPNSSIFQKVFVSFYGGEPLLNMTLIKQIVEYCQKVNSQNRQFVFSMTSNAMLLERHMDFLAKHDFSLLVSLDGNESGHSYRVDPSGRSSFEKVIENVDLLKEKYPGYFHRKVNFNAVLHNRNSVSAIYDFIYGKYGKTPRIAPLNDSGIKPGKVKDFYAMYRNVNESLKEAEHYPEIEKSMFLNLPEYKDTAIFLKQYSGYIYENYNTLFVNRPKQPLRFLPTGTCSPFSKKIFITVNGKILPCERIGQQFSLGNINDKNEVILDPDEIALRYNGYFSKLKKYCLNCYRKASCIQCVYYMEDINHEKPVCYGYTGKEMFAQYVGNFMSFLEEHREDYDKIMNEVTLN